MKPSLNIKKPRWGMLIFTVTYYEIGNCLFSVGFTSNVGDTRSPSVKCLLRLFQKLWSWASRICCSGRGQGNVMWTWRGGGRGGRGSGFDSWQQGTAQRDKNHSSLHTLSHRGSQLTSQCFNPSSLQNKGATAIDGRGPIYTLASKRLLAAQRNL